MVFLVDAEMSVIFDLWIFEGKNPWKNPEVTLIGKKLRHCRFNPKLLMFLQGDIVGLQGDIDIYYMYMVISQQN